MARCLAVDGQWLLWTTECLPVTLPFPCPLLFCIWYLEFWRLGGACPVSPSPCCLALVCGTHRCAWETETQKGGTAGESLGSCRGDMPSLASPSRKRRTCLCCPNRCRKLIGQDQVGTWCIPEGPSYLLSHLSSTGRGACCDGKRGAPARTPLPPDGKGLPGDGALATSGESPGAGGGETLFPTPVTIPLASPKAPRLRLLTYPSTVVPMGQVGISEVGAPGWSWVGGR